MSTRRTFPLATVLLLVGVGLAGCMSQEGEAALVPLEFRAHPTLGEILVDGMGKTLYVFTNDDPGVSKCYDQCAANWPPLIRTETPPAPSGIEEELSLVARTDGSKQLAYRDRPLYYHVGDTAAGDAKGDGLNGVWFVIRKPPTNAQLLNGKGPLGVTTEEPTYFTAIKGFYAKPNGSAPKTGIVMIHEWWGLNANIKEMAKILASNDYLVLAVDLFHGQVATTSQQAQALVATHNQAEANQNMRAAAEYLRDQGATRIVSLGWCFGGGQSLQLALSGEQLNATVIYYGSLETDQSKLSVIKWPVLGIFGEADTSIPPATVRVFERALNNLTIENDVYIYPDVGHAFANPSGDAWAPEETKDAWARTLAFTKQHAGG